MVIFFQVLAVILALVAAYLWWQGSTDGLFLAAVAGAVSFFLSIRFQVKARVAERSSAAVDSDGSDTP